MSEVFEQELAEQAAAKALELQQAGEGLRLSVDQEQRLQEVASLRGELEKLKAESAGKIDLLQKEKSSLEEKNKILQEKNKKLAKNHKGNSLVLILPIVKK